MSAKNADARREEGEAPKSVKQEAEANPMGRTLKEVRRRVKVIGAFPDGRSALMLCAAWLRHVASKTWSTRKYMDMGLLKNHTATPPDALATGESTAAQAAASTLAG